MGNLRENQENGGVVLSEEQKELLKTIGEQYTQSQANRIVEKKEVEEQRKEEEEKKDVMAKVLERQKQATIEAQVAIAVEQSKKAIDQIEEETGKKLTDKEKVEIRRYLLTGERTNPQQKIIDAQLKEAGLDGER